MMIITILTIILLVTYIGLTIRFTHYKIKEEQIDNEKIIATYDLVKILAKETADVYILENISEDICFESFNSEMYELVISAITKELILILNHNRLVEYDEVAILTRNVVYERVNYFLNQIKETEKDMKVNIQEDVNEVYENFYENYQYNDNADLQKIIDSDFPHGDGCYQYNDHNLPIEDNLFTNNVTIDEFIPLSTTEIEND